MEGSTCKPGACLIPNLGHAQKMDLRFGECFGRSIFSYFGIRWQQNLVNFFIYVRVYYLATVEWSEFLPGSSLSPLALKQQQTRMRQDNHLLQLGVRVIVGGIPSCANAGALVNPVNVARELALRSLSMAEFGNRKLSGKWASVIFSLFGTLRNWQAKS